MLKWIWCDIDGDGRFWRLAKEYHDEIYFLKEDIIERAENFLHYPQMGVSRPNVVPLARCAQCNQTTSALETETIYYRGKPFCRECSGDQND